MAEKSDGNTGFANRKPSGDGGSDSGPIDPATLGGNGTGNDSGSDQPKRKRGRPAGSGKSGSGTGSAKASNKGNLKESVDALSKIMLVMHVGIATISKTPELAIDNDESDLLANATVNLLSEFDITPDPKTQAAIALVVAAGTVYAPRIVAIRMRKKREKNDAKNTVIDMTEHLKPQGAG